MVTITATKLKYYILLKRNTVLPDPYSTLTPYLYSLSVKAQGKTILDWSIPKQPENISHQKTSTISNRCGPSLKVYSAPRISPLAAPMVPLSQPRTSKCHSRTILYQDSQAPKSMNPSGYLKKELKVKCIKEGAIKLALNSKQDNL